MSQTIPTLTIGANGETEEWAAPEDAAYFSESSNNETIDISDEGDVVTVVGHDASGQRVELEYRLSKVMVELALFDDPDDAPTKMEWATAYPLDEFKGGDWTIEHDEEFDVKVAERPVETKVGVRLARELLAPEELRLGGESITLPDDARALWDRAETVSFEADYVATYGLDGSDSPGPNPYEVYYILTKAMVGDEEPFFTHPKLQENE